MVEVWRALTTLGKPNEKESRCQMLERRIAAVLVPGIFTDECVSVMSTHVWVADHVIKFSIDHYESTHYCNFESIVLFSSG